MKKYIVLAGVNGAGKSTLFQTQHQLKKMPRINTDEILKGIGDWRNIDNLMQAGKIAIRKIDNYFVNGISFNQETTLCGNLIVKSISRAKALGYIVEIHFVSVDSVEIAKNRVAYRVAHGGHGVPEHDIERRYYKSMERIREFIPICDLVVMYDNTEQLRRIAIFKKGEKVRESHNVPKWYAEEISSYLQ